MPDLSTRPATVADAESIHRLIGKPHVSLDAIASDLTRPGLHLQRDTLLVHTAGGELVAWAWVHLGRRAEAYVRQAFHDIRRHGLRGCEVWTHSDTGALGFYQRAGMTVTQSGAHYSKQL